MEYGRYSIVKELGRGSMGVVYQAHDPQIDRMLALKVLRPDRVTSEAFATRFLKEARAIGRLSHPHIVTVFDVGKDHGTIFIAMEFLEGEPLNEVIVNGSLDLAQSLNIVKQIATALYYAHQQGIVHRDIKPSNIILTHDMQVKLTDFGIARIDDAGAGLQTQAGEILGTPMYMSPEQVMGEKADGRSDLYSLGVILYEMVAGKRPFNGNNLASIFRSITHDVPDPPASIDPIIGRASSDLIMKSLDKHPDRRFQTGQQMAEALAAIERNPNANSKAAQEKRTVSRKATLVYVLLPSLLIGAAAASYHYFTQSTPLAPASLPEAPAPAPQETVVKIPNPDPVVQKANLSISSKPAGADLYVDSVYAGQTPFSLQLPLGKYELRLSLAGHLAWEAQVELDTPEDMPLHIPLQADP